MIDKNFFGETKGIEFKREIPKNHEKFLKDIIAFSNCSGGKVILGIEDITNTVYGIGDENPFKLSDDISNMVSDACTPQIEPYISMETIEGKTVLIIDVPPGKFRPYFLKSLGKETSSYIRINGTSRPADQRKLHELELEGQKVSYDSLQDIGQDYDEEKAIRLCRAMEQIAIESCQTEEEKKSIKKMTIEKLEDFGLLCRVGRDLYPTHAFMLMTDNRFYYAKIQCALFKGLTRDIFIDKKEFEGPIYIQIDDAYKFVLKHINIGAEIKGILRRDTYELPIDAVREMIANAVAHRSYLDDSAIQVSIYDDRIEVSSPGMLYGGMDLETAKQGKSRCRNAAIAKTFHYMHIIETWGTGIPRIISRCKEYGLRPPLFEEFGDGFKVTMFRKESSAPEKVSSAPEKVSSASEKVSSASEKVSSSPLNFSDDMKKAGNDTVAKNKEFSFYEVMLEKAQISTKYIANIEIFFEKFKDSEAGMLFAQADIMTLLECSKSKATNVMNAMKKAGIIEIVKGYGIGKYRFLEK